MVTKSAGLALVVSALLVSGCVPSETLSYNAVNYNLAVEEAHNRGLLLNVVRASQRAPLYITDISGVTGSLKAEVTSGGLSIPFGSGNKSRADYKFGPQATFSTNPTFNVAVLDSQEFVRGFLTPLGNDVFAYYLEQGWRPEFLLHLLVRQVHIRSKEGDLHYDNYPDSTDPDLCKWREFSQWVQKFVASEVRVERVPSYVGPSFTDAKGLDGILAAGKDQLRIETDPQDPTKFRLRRAADRLEIRISKSVEVSYQNPSGDPVVWWPKSCEGKEAKLDKSEEAQSAGSQAARGDMAARSEETRVIVEGGDKDTEIVFLLRSPEGLVYYLGELLRTELKDRYPKVCIQKRMQPIFYVQKSEGLSPSAQRLKCRAEVAVDYRSADFVIPETRIEQEPDGCTAGTFAIDDHLACDSGRSMHALSLLSQLISLQKSGKDVPTTELVRVVGE